MNSVTHMFLLAVPIVLVAFVVAVSIENRPLKGRS